MTGAGMQRMIEKALYALNAYLPPHPSLFVGAALRLKSSLLIFHRKRVILYVHGGVL